MARYLFELMIGDAGSRCDVVVKRSYPACVAYPACVVYPSYYGYPTSRAVADFGLGASKAITRNDTIRP